MAPTPSDSTSSFVVASRLVGRLIGRGGATIQQLESHTDCRVRTSVCAEKNADGEALTSISVHAECPCPPAERVLREARCSRAAQFLCNESLSIRDALAQADRDALAQAEQECVEDARWEEEQDSISMRRIQISFPEFDEDDVRSALREAFDDEDLAIDMLHGGYRAPHQVYTRSKQAQVEIEEFPSLLRPAASSCSNNLTAWSKRAAAATKRASAGGCAEEFPGLPAAAPAPRKIRPTQSRLRRRA